MRGKVPFTYNWGEPLDENFHGIVRTAQHKVTHSDDYRLLIVGDTGSGKSHLGLHLIEAFMQEPSIKGTGLNEAAYAKAVKWAYDQRKNGAPYIPCFYDEANVYSTEVMKEFNKEIMKLLGEVRGMNIFHIWAMPNPGRLQSDFIDETFDAIIFIFTKDEKRPRLYDFFDRKAIDRMRRKEGTPRMKARITLDMLRTVHSKYATFRGCFTEYRGVLRRDYETMKTEKMGERVDDFYERFGGTGKSGADLARKFMVSEQSISNWAKRLMEEGELVDGKHFKVNLAGKRIYTEEGAKVLEEKGPPRKKKLAKGEGVEESSLMTPHSFISSREPGGRAP